MKTKLLLVFTVLLFQNSFATTVLAPIGPNLSPLQYCDQNNDGFGIFDLESVTSTIIAAQSGSASDFVVTYHETLFDAESGISALLSPYENIEAWSQMVYYRVRQISTNEYATGAINLVVNPTPEATTPADYHLCDVNSPIGMETFNLPTVIPEVLGTIDPTSVSVTFHNSQFDAQAGVNAITAMNYSNSTIWSQTIYIRVTIVSTGCYDVVPLTLIVDPLPQSMQPNYPEYVLCEDDAPLGYEIFDLGSRLSLIALGQVGVSVSFYPSLGDAQNNTNVIQNLLYTNQVAYVQTLGIRITNMATGCFVLSTMDIRVAPKPNLVAPTTPYTVCDNNQDGFAAFDLTPLIAEVNPGALYTISFHETLLDAQLEGSPITSPFYNITPFSQIIYVRGEDNISGCYAIIPIELQVNTAPIAPSLNPLAVCDADSNPQNGMTVINLTVKTADILLQQPNAASNYSVIYCHSQFDAEAGISPIVPATNYIGTQGETIWYRVEFTSTGCYAVGSFQLIVNSALALATLSPLQACDSDANPNDQYTAFDLTVRDNEIVQGHPGAFVTYYPSLINAQTGTNAIANPTAYINTVPSVQTLGVVVSSSTGCQSITTMDVRVIPIPTPNTNPPPLVPQCDVNNPGDLLEVFDLIVNRDYISNGNPNLIFHYFPTMADALDGFNEILTPTAAVVGGNVWIKVENSYVDYFGNHCYVLVEQPLSINPLPDVDLVSDNTQNTVFVDGDNNVVQPLTLNAQLTGNYGFEWSLEGNVLDGNSATYTVMTASPNGADRTYSVLVTNLMTGCSATSSIVVSQSAGTPSPLGLTYQTFVSGATLADIIVSGTNVQWYAVANKNNLTTFSVPLPLNTVLVDGMTYYATQTVGGIESTAYLPVTVQIVLGIDTNEILPIQYAPNPVKDTLTLQSTTTLKSVVVYTMLGQKVFEQYYNDTNINIDMSNLASGNYILKAQGETAQKTIRIIKE